MSNATDSRLSPQNKKLMAWLKAQRVDKGLNMREVGARLNTAHSRIGKYENCGRRLDVGEYFEACAAIGCDPFVGLQLVYGSNFDTIYFTTDRPRNCVASYEQPTGEAIDVLHVRESCGLTFEAIDTNTFDTISNLIEAMAAGSTVSIYLHGGD